MRNIQSQPFKTLGMLLVLSMMFALTTVIASAQTYPTKPIRLIIPFPPGGGTDIIGRPIANQLSERLGKQVYIDNRGGAGSVIGNDIAAKADPDGHTLLMNGNTFIIGATLRPVPYDTLKSFTPIAGIGSGPTVLFVIPTFPAKSVKDLIALAKQKPGELLFASSGVGSGNHMAIELFKIMAGIDFRIVHFKGAGPALTDLLGGHVDVMFATIGQPLPHIKAGRLRGLGTGGVKRSISLPDLPTIAEAGVPGFEVGQWWGIWAPAGTPGPIVDRLTKEIKEILATDEVKKSFLSSGSEAGYLAPTEFVSFLKGERAKWTRVVKDANIKLEK